MDTMMMRALVRDDTGVRLARIPALIPAAGEVAIAVAFAGVCRTDLAVADGRIAVADGRVLGHELSGRIASLGDGVTGIAVGDPVTAIPFAPCGRCGCVPAPGERADTDRRANVDGGGISPARPAEVDRDAWSSARR